MKCLVHNCKNHNDEGKGVYIYIQDENHVEGIAPKWVCMPCLSYITTGRRGNSAIEQDFRETPSVWPPWPPLTEDNDETSKT
jgi:hypothetical protein